MFLKNRYACGFSKNNIILSTIDVKRKKHRVAINIRQIWFLGNSCGDFFFQLSRDDPRRFDGNTINTHLKQNDEMEGRGIKIVHCFPAASHGNSGERCAT